VAEQPSRTRETTKQSGRKPKTLSAEDKARMRRLQEEIAARYFEMAMVMERVLGDKGLRTRAMKPGGKITMAFKSVGSHPTDEAADYYLCIEVDGGAWEDPPGICRYGGC
jgi:hypothetical protein